MIPSKCELLFHCVSVYGTGAAEVNKESWQVADSLSWSSNDSRRETRSVQPGKVTIRRRVVAANWSMHSDMRRFLTFWFNASYMSAHKYSLHLVYLSYSFVVVVTVIYSAPPVRVTACLSVCLSVCPLAYIRNNWPELQKIFAHATYGRDSVFLWLCCDM